jgi:hypothetical protein
MKERSTDRREVRCPTPESRLAGICSRRCNWIVSFAPKRLPSGISFVPYKHDSDRQRQIQAQARLTNRMGHMVIEAVSYDAGWRDGQDPCQGTMGTEA